MTSHRHRYHRHPLTLTFTHRPSPTHPLTHPPAQALVVGSAAPFPILHATPSWLKMCGYTTDEVIGRTPKILQGEGTEEGQKFKTLWDEVVRLRGQTDHLEQERPYRTLPLTLAQSLTLFLSLAPTLTLTLMDHLDQELAAALAANERLALILSASNERL